MGGDSNPRPGIVIWPSTALLMLMSDPFKMVSNQTNFEERLAFVHGIVDECFHLEATATIQPIAYDPHSSFTYNNFIYKIGLPPSSSERWPEEQPKPPGCVPVPANMTDFVVRLTNAKAAGMNKEGRVENEVAMINLFSDALGHMEPKIVPAVYHWGSAAGQDSQGWMLQQFMPGKPVDEALHTMTADQKRNILAQVAEVLSAIQSYRLPQSITSFGGLNFDEEGNIMSGPMASVGAGPWSSYEDSFTEQMQRALAGADANFHIKGWEANGLRQRLVGFMDNGIPAAFQALDSKDEKVLTHADLTANNLLFDPVSGGITALLDYDLACIAHPSYEFLRSFGDIGGHFQGWSGNRDDEQLALRDGKVHGFPSPLPQSSNGNVDWEMAKQWERELERRKVKRPSTINGMEAVADVDAVLQMVTPWRLTNPDVLELQSEAAIAEYREQCKQALAEMLGRLGF